MLRDSHRHREPVAPEPAHQDRAVHAYGLGEFDGRLRDREGGYSEGRVCGRLHLRADEPGRLHDPGAFVGDDSGEFAGAEAVGEAAVGGGE